MLLLAGMGTGDRCARGQTSGAVQAGLVSVGQEKSGQNKAGQAAAEQAPGLASREEAGKPPLTQKQRDLQTDVKRLAMLAAQLKVSVDKSTKDQLSLDVVRRADEIEKLAKSVKERMRTAQ